MFFEVLGKIFFEIEGREASKSVRSLWSRVLEITILRSRVERTIPPELLIPFPFEGWREDLSEI